MISDPNTELSELEFTTAAPKILAQHNILTIGNLLNSERAKLAKIDGMGAARMKDIDRVLERHGLTFSKNSKENHGFVIVCRDCPTCPQCGNPRATTCRAVARGVDGRYKHHGFQATPTCDDCNTHHRALFETVAAA